MYLVLIFLHFRSLILPNVTLEDYMLYLKEHKRELGDSGTNPGFMNCSVPINAGYYCYY